MLSGFARAAGLPGFKVLICFLLLGQAATWLNQSGATWDILGQRLSRQDRFVIQASLFERSAARPPAPVILVGDEAFVDRFMALPGAPAAVQAVLLPELGFAALADFLQVLDPAGVQRIVLQFRPYLFSDARPAVGRPDLKLFKRTRVSRYSVVPVSDVRLFLDSLVAWAKVRRNDARGAAKPLSNIDEIEFRDDLSDQDRAQRQIQRFGKERFVWVRDDEGVDRDSNPQFFSRLDEFLSQEGNTRAYGRMLQPGGASAWGDSPGQPR